MNDLELAIEVCLALLFTFVFFYIFSRDDSIFSIWIAQRVLDQSQGGATYLFSNRFINQLRRGIWLELELAPEKEKFTII